VFVQHVIYAFSVSVAREYEAHDWWNTEQVYYTCNLELGLVSLFTLDNIVQLHFKLINIIQYVTVHTQRQIHFGSCFGRKQVFRKKHSCDAQCPDAFVLAPNNIKYPISASAQLVLKPSFTALN